MRDIGSFIDLELCSGKEYYSEEKCGEHNILRLNNCRNAIYHAVRCYEVKKVWLPIYECDTVRDTLINHGVEVAYYRIDNHFIPQIRENEKQSAIVFPNYYGVFPASHFENIILSGNYNNVIIDNAQAFFARPISGCINVYSPRKFNGVADGAYVIGENVKRLDVEYPHDYSSDTSLFLLMRTEYGCAGKAYEQRKTNEDRINNAEIRRMSLLTQKLLDSYDYPTNIQRRKENFEYARELFDEINHLNIDNIVDETCVPMVYPLIVEKEEVIDYFHNNHVFQGHWWEYIVDETTTEMFENYLSRYIVPITIDQRYGKEEILFQYQLVMEALKK